MLPIDVTKTEGGDCIRFNQHNENTTPSNKIVSTDRFRQSSVDLCF